MAGNTFHFSRENQEELKESPANEVRLPASSTKKNSENQILSKPTLILPQVSFAGAFCPDIGELGICLDGYTRKKERGENGAESLNLPPSSFRESSERLSLLLREDSSFTGVLKALESNRKDLEDRVESSTHVQEMRSLQEGLEKLERGIASFEKGGSGIFLSDLLDSLCPKGDPENIFEKGRVIAELKESYEKKHSQEVFSPEKSLFRDKADLLEIFQSIRRIGVLQGEGGLSDEQKSLILQSLLMGKEEVIYVLEAKLTLDRLTENLIELKELKTSHDINQMKLSVYEKELLENHGDSKEVPYKDKNGKKSTKLEKISTERVKGLREEIESLSRECRLSEESMMVLQKRGKVYQTNLVLCEGELHALRSPDKADIKLLESLQAMERDSWSRSPRLVELWGRAMSRLEDSSVSEVMKHYLRGNEWKARELAKTSYEEKRKWGEYLRQEERGGIKLKEGSYDLVHKTQGENLGSGLKSLQEIKEEGLSFYIGEDSKKVIDRLEEQSKGIQYLELEGGKSRFVKISKEGKAKLSEVPEGYTAVLKRLPEGIRFEKQAVGKMVEELDLSDMTGSGLKKVYRESGFVGVPDKITEAETLRAEDIVYVRKEESSERLLVLDRDQELSKGFKEIRLEEQKAKEDFLQVLRNDPGVQKALGTGSYVFERYVHLMSSLEKGMAKGQKREDWVEAVRSDAKELGQLLRRSDLSMQSGKMEKVSGLLSGLSESITPEGGLELEYLGGLCGTISNLLKEGEIERVIKYIEGADFDPDSVGKWMRTNGVLIGSTLLGATALASIPATMGTSSLGAVAILSGIGGYIGGEIGNAALSLDYKSFKSKMQRYAAEEISFGEYIKESGLEIGYGAAFTYGIGHVGRFVGGAARNQLAQSGSFGIRELPAYAVVQGAKVFEKFEHLSSKLIPGGQQNYLRIWMSEFIEEAFEEGLEGGFGGAGGVLLRSEDSMSKAIGAGFLGVSQSIAILTSARRPNGSYPGGTTFRGFGEVSKMVSEGVFESQFEYDSGKSNELKEFLNRSGKRVIEGENGELRVEGVVRGKDGEVVCRQAELYIPTQVPGYVRTLMKESVRADGSSVFTDCGFRVNQQGEMLINSSHTKEGVSLAKYLSRQGIVVVEDIGGRISIERGGVRAEIRVSGEREAVVKENETKDVQRENSTDAEIDGVTRFPAAKEGVNEESFKAPESENLTADNTSSAVAESFVRRSNMAAASSNVMWDELLNLLKKGALIDGDLPQIYLENERVIPPRSESGEMFQNEMERITKLLLPDYPLDTHPIRFLITDRGDSNAYVIPGHKPTIIAFDKSILEFFKSEDELAYVLGHELTHLKLTEELGRGRNSKGEEYTADIRPLAWMHRAGYDAKEAIEYTKREALKGGKVSWFNVADVHGLPTHRVDAVENAIAGLDKHVGGMHNEKRDVSKELVSAVSEALHTSYLDKVKLDHQYDSLGPLEKLAVLRSEIPNQNIEHIERSREMFKALSELEIDPNLEDHAKALSKTVTELTANPDAFNHLFSIVAKKRFGSVQNLKPIGILVKVAKAARDLVEAQTSQDANKAADRLLSTLDSMDSDKLNLSKVRWPRFKLPTRRELKESFEDGDFFLPPWDDHIKWVSSGSNIPMALLRMGVTDPRLLNMLSEEQLQDYANGKTRHFTTPRIPNEQYKGVKFNPIGEIYSFDKSDLPTSGRNAAEVLVEIRAIEARSDNIPLSAADSTNRISFIGKSTEEFYQNYEKYFDENKYLITVPATLRDPLSESILGPTNVSKREQREEEGLFDRHSSVLVNMLDRMLKEDKEKYGDFVKGFFLGRDDNRDLNHIVPFDSHMSHYALFVINDRHNLFSVGEKAIALKGQQIINTTGDGGVDHVSELKAYRKILKYDVPSDISELEMILDRYKEFCKYDESYRCADIAAASEIETFFYPSSGHKPGSLQMSSLIINHGQFLIQAAQRENETTRRNLINHIAKEKLPRGSENRIVVYKILEEARLFPSDAWRKNLADSIVTSIKNRKNPEDRIALIEKLLLGKGIRDVDLRTKAIDMWVNDNLKLFGKDVGTEAFHATHDKAFTNMVERVKNATELHQRYEMFAKLADSMETQVEWSYQLRDNLIERSREKLTETHLSGVFGEGTLTVISRQENLRKETIEYLIAPFSKKSQERFAENVLLLTGNNLNFKYDKAELMITARRIYENYWNAPMPARVVIMDQLLISSEERQQDRIGTNSQENYHKAFQYVVDMVIPKNMNYADQARKFLEAYSNVIPRYQRTLLLSSMMVAGERAGRSGGENVGVGKRLAMILELMGPAERKLGQTVHSHPQTPDDIREDMERLKSMAAPPARWDLIARYEAVVPKEYQQEIQRIGNLKGAASYFMTLGLEHTDDTKSVMAIQRENATAQAKEGFRLLHGLVDELRNTDEDLGKVADTVTEMIQQAESMSDIETNSDIGRIQVELAQDLYNGLKITVDGETFDFSTAQWLAYGSEFRDQKEMPGKHFNDLPEQTDKQKAYKKAVAKAYLAAEFLNILKGGVFDHDRHGAQLKVSGNKIGLFDHGAMETETPSEKDKQQLATTLFQGLSAYQKGTPLAEVMYDEINKIKDETGKTPEYLVRVERGLLALSDFFRYITPNDIPDILLGVYETGKVDATIQNTLMVMVMSGKIDASIIEQLASSTTAVVIEKNDVAPPPPPPPRRFETKVEIAIPDANAGSSGFIDGKTFDERNPR